MLNFWKKEIYKEIKTLQSFVISENHCFKLPPHICNLLFSIVLWFYLVESDFQAFWYTRNNTFLFFLFVSVIQISSLSRNIVPPFLLFVSVFQASSHSFNIVFSVEIISDKKLKYTF